MHQLHREAIAEGSKGQKYAERGFRFLKAPLFLALPLYLRKPQRIMPS